MYGDKPQVEKPKKYIPLVPIGKAIISMWNIISKRRKEEKRDVDAS